MTTISTTDLQNNYLLGFHNQIWLSTAIEAAHAEDIAAQLAYVRHFSKNPIHLYINTLGGDSTTAMAILNLIREDGNVHAHLTTTAASAGALIFAACSKRYVYPDAMLGIHSAAYEFPSQLMNVYGLRYELKRLEAMNRAQCAIYASASNKRAQWWQRMLSREKDMRWFSADELVTMGMAEWAREQEL